MAEEEGYTPWRTPLIWAKGSMGHAPDPMRGPKRTYETILFCRKGDHRIKAAHSDVISIPPAKDKVHAAEKPIALYKELLSWGCVTGDHVLDPTAGSCNILYAAKALNLKALCIEENENFARRGSALATAGVPAHD